MVPHHRGACGLKRPIPVRLAEFVWQLRCTELPQEFEQREERLDPGIAPTVRHEHTQPNGFNQLRPRPVELLDVGLALKLIVPQAPGKDVMELHHRGYRWRLTAAAHRPVAVGAPAGLAMVMCEAPRWDFRPKGA